MNSANLSADHVAFLNTAVEKAKTSPKLVSNYVEPTDITMFTRLIFEELGWPTDKDKSVMIANDLANAGFLRLALPSSTGWSFYVTNEGMDFAQQLSVCSSNDLQRSGAI